MSQTVSNSYDRSYFLQILKNSWPSSKVQFSSDEEAYYNHYLIEFCNANSSFDFTKEESILICSFIKKSLFSFFDLSIDTMILSQESITNISNLLIFIEYLSLYGKGHVINNFFSSLLPDVLSYTFNTDLNSKEYDFLFHLFDETTVFEKICIFTSRYIDLSIPDDIISNFINLLHHRKQEVSFCLCLYPFNNSYINTNYRFYPEECSSKELYLGILSGYFPINSRNNTYKALISLCDNASDDIIHLASFDNPVYVLWKISNSCNGISLLNHRYYVDRLFRH